MPHYMEVQLKQRVGIEFLTAEGESSTVIRRRMRAVYGQACLDRSTVKRWVYGSRTEKPGTSVVCNKCRCGRPKTEDSAEHR